MTENVQGKDAQVRPKVERSGGGGREKRNFESPDVSSSRPRRRERLSQNRTSVVHIRLLGTSGYHPGCRPGHDLALSLNQLELNLGGNLFLRKPP